MNTEQDISMVQWFNRQYCDPRQPRKMTTNELHRAIRRGLRMHGIKHPPEIVQQVKTSLNDCGLITCDRGLGWELKHRMWMDK